MAKLYEQSNEEVLESKTSYVLFTDYWDKYWCNLSDEQAGQLIKKIAYYERFREEISFNQIVDTLFNPIKVDLDNNDNDWATERKIRSLKGSNHTGNQYTRRKQKELELQRLINNKMEQCSTNGTDGTVTDTVTEFKALSLNVPRLSDSSESEINTFPEDIKVNEEVNLKSFPVVPPHHAERSSAIENNEALEDIHYSDNFIPLPPKFDEDEFFRKYENEKVLVINEEQIPF